MSASTTSGSNRFTKTGLSIIVENKVTVYLQAEVIRFAGRQLRNSYPPARGEDDLANSFLFTIGLCRGLLARVELPLDHLQ